MFSNRITWALLVFAAVAAPLPFGSNDPFIIAFWCLVLGIALVVCNLRTLKPVHYVLLASAALVSVAYAFVLHEQIASRPWIAAPHPIWAETAKALQEPLQPSASIVRNQPWYSIGRPLLCMLTLTAAFVVGVDRVLAWRLLRVVAWAGAAYAFYSIAAFLIEPTKVLWREKPAYFNVLTGTFINRNTAAAFFGICSVVWLLIMLEEIRELLPRQFFSLEDTVRRILDNTTRRLTVSIVMLLSCLAAMFLTVSRSGVVLSLAALLLAITLSYRRVLPTRMSVLSLVLIAAVILYVLLQILGSGVESRYYIQGFEGGGRLATYRSTLNMITDQPWFGTGLGTFEAAYPAYRTGEVTMWGTWDRAHNTLLELTSDLGIPLAGMVVIGWILVITLLVRGSLRRRRDVALPIAGLAVALLGLGHSLVDFSLQTPGFAVIFFAIVGNGLTQSFSSRERGGGSVDMVSNIK